MSNVRGLKPGAPSVVCILHNMGTMSGTMYTLESGATNTAVAGKVCGVYVWEREMHTERTSGGSMGSWFCEYLKCIVQ